MTIQKSWVEYYFQHFIARDDVVYQQWTNGARSGYELTSRKVDLNVIQQHLSGTITVAAPAFDTKGFSVYACWDSDEESDKLTRIAGFLQTIDFYPLLEGRRKGRDGHLWLLFDYPVPAIDLLRLNKEICAHVNIPISGIEFFPKQATAGVGNGIRLPLGINLKREAQGARGWFEGADKNLESQLKWLIEQPLNSSSVVSAIAENLKNKDSYIVKRVNKNRSWSNSPEEVFAALLPTRKGEYFECLCPSCGQRTAYFYQDGSMLMCNRQNKCKFQITMAQWLKEKEPRHS